MFAPSQVLTRWAAVFACGWIMHRFCASSPTTDPVIVKDRGVIVSNFRAHFCFHGQWEDEVCLRLKQVGTSGFASSVC